MSDKRGSLARPRVVFTPRLAGRRDSGSRTHETPTASYNLNLWLRPMLAILFSPPA